MINGPFMRERDERRRLVVQHASALNPDSVALLTMLSHSLKRVNK